jgi:hypothetical protein
MQIFGDLFCAMYDLIWELWHHRLYYLMFGDNIESQIALNLPWEATSSCFAILVPLIIPFVKYALMVTPLAICGQTTTPTPQDQICVFKYNIWDTLGAELLLMAINKRHSLAYLQQFISLHMLG